MLIQSSLIALSVVFLIDIVRCVQRKCHSLWKSVKLVEQFVMGKYAVSLKRQTTKSTCQLFLDWL